MTKRVNFSKTPADGIFSLSAGGNSYIMKDEFKNKLKKVTRDIISNITFGIIAYYKKKTIRKVKIETAKAILETADTLRNSVDTLILALICIGIVSAGVVIAILGFCFLFVLFLFPQLSPMFQIALSLIIGGLFSFLMTYFFIFAPLVSEKVWMQKILSNPVIGPTIEEALIEAKKKLQRDGKE